MSVAVTRVSSESELKEFILAPQRIYENNPHWVPPLAFLHRQELSATHNPFFRHADVELFVARDDSKVIGRISAQVDHEHNRYHNEKTGFFGFFESPNDPEAAAALITAATSWLKQRGMSRVRGPLSFSINGQAGLLIDSFDCPPQIMMPYTHPYYPNLLEGTGFSKVKDLYAWRFDWTTLPVKANQSIRRLREHPDVNIRIANMSRFQDEVRTILDIFNEAWAENWGFVPMTALEGEKFGNDLKLIVDPNVVIIIEVKGQVAGAVVGAPNLNEAIRDLKGSLFPLGFLKLFWRIKRRRIRNGRILLMGVRKAYRTREFSGMPYLLIDELLRRGSSRYQWAELSWTLEDNHAINKLITHMGCEHYKTYRLYEKELL